MMYIIYNHDGSIKEKNLNEFIQQGDNLTKQIAVAIVGYEPSAFALSAVFKLPDGSQVVLISEDETTITDSKGQEYSGVKIALTEEVTALEGVVKANIQAVNTSDKVLTSYTTYITINEGVSPDAIAMMSQKELHDLIALIEINVTPDETIVVLTSAPTTPSGFELGQIAYYDYKFYKLESNGWTEFYNFLDHYTKTEIQNLLADKQDKLTEESLPTAQLQYAVGFDAQGNLRKGAGGGGGGAIYNAGTGIDITNFTISIDDTVVATKSFVSETYETITHASTTYATKTELETVKKNAFIKVNTTTYPTLASFLLSTGEEGYIYLYPIDTTDLTKGYYQYIWEDNEWLGIGSTRIDLSNYVTLDSAQTLTGEKTFASQPIFQYGIKLQNSNSSNYAVIDMDSTTTVTRFYQSRNLAMKYDNNSFTFYRLLRPATTNTYDLGTSSQKWKDLYLSGKIKDGTNEFNADNVFNVINASDIVNNTLTQAQFDLITNGKPTLIKGTFLNYVNPILLSCGNTYNVLEGYFVGATGLPAKSVIGKYYITYEKAISFRAEFITFNYNSNTIKLPAVAEINGKSIPAYPSDTTKQYKFVQKVGGNLDYVEDDIESIKTQSTGGATSIQLKTWVGTQAQYDSILTKDANTQYIII